MSTTTLASERARTCSSSLLASGLLISVSDQHPSKPHEVAVAVGVKVWVGGCVGPGGTVVDGVVVSAGVVGTGVCVLGGVFDGVGVFVRIGVLDGGSVLDGVSVRDGVSVIVGVRDGVRVTMMNWIVLTTRVYCWCGSLSSARNVMVYVAPLTMGTPFGQEYELISAHLLLRQ